MFSPVINRVWYEPIYLQFVNTLHNFQEFLHYIFYYPHPPKFFTLLRLRLNYEENFQEFLHYIFYYPHPPKFFTLLRLRLNYEEQFNMSNLLTSKV